MTLPSYFAGLIPTVLGAGSTVSLGTTVEFWRSLQPKGGCDAEARVPGWRQKATHATAWGPAAPGPLGAETQNP